jgi:hypothetical protein
MLKKDVREWLIKVDFADYCESFKGMFYDGHIVPRADRRRNSAKRRYFSILIDIYVTLIRI